MQINKEEIAKVLYKNFELLENMNTQIFKQPVKLESSEIAKNNVLAMCEIANTLNNIKN